MSENQTQPQAMMKCDWCGKEFIADPRACVESGISATYQPEEGEEWKGEQPVSMDPREVIKEDREMLKRELEVDDKELDELLKTGEVGGLAAIVCIQCQDEAEKAANE